MKNGVQGGARHSLNQPPMPMLGVSWRNQELSDIKRKKKKMRCLKFAYGFHATVLWCAAKCFPPPFKVAEHAFS